MDGIYNFLIRGNLLKYIEYSLYLFKKLEFNGYIIDM